MVNFLSTRTLKNFPVNLFFSQLAPVCIAECIYSSPGTGFCTSLVELSELPVDSLLQTLEVSLNDSTTL